MDEWINELKKIVEACFKGDISWKSDFSRF